MSKFKYANNAATTLAAGIASGDLSLTVQTGAGALFPSPGAGEQFNITLVDSLSNYEIVKVTNRSTDTFTIVRSQEGTTAQAFSLGDKVELRVTAAGLTNNLQVEDLGVSVQPYDADTAKLDVDQTFTGAQRGTITTDNDGSFDLDVTNFWLCTPTAGFTLTFTNIPAAGQGGFIKLVNGSNYAVAAHANTKVTSSFLAAVSVTGTYIINYVSDGTNVHCSTAGASA